MSERSPRIRSARIRPPRLAAATPSPTQPPAQARPGRGVGGDRRHPVALGAEHARPGVRDRHLARGRPQRVQLLGEAAHGPVLDLAVAVVARAPVVRAPPAADRDAAVGGALDVGVRQRRVGDRLGVRPADLVPDRLRERVGDDDRRAQRDDLPPEPGQAGRVALGGAHDPRRADVAVVGAGAAALDGRDGRALVDRRRRVARPRRRGRAPARPAARAPRSGSNTAPSAPAMRTRSASAGGSSHSPCASGWSRSRSSCVGPVATASAPPLWNAHSICSAAQTRPTSSTVSVMAATVASSCTPATAPATQPPLRPDAP